MFSFGQIPIVVAIDDQAHFRLFLALEWATVAIYVFGGVCGQMCLELICVDEAPLAKLALEGLFSPVSSGFVGFQVTLEISNKYSPNFNVGS